MPRASIWVCHGLKNSRVLTLRNLTSCAVAGNELRLFSPLTYLDTIKIQVDITQNERTKKRSILQIRD